MVKNITDSNNFEKILLLPDECEIAVTRSWCFSVIKELSIRKGYAHLLRFVRESADISCEKTVYVPNYVTMTVGDVKKLVDVCGWDSLCCIFPHNYDDIVDSFLYTRLDKFKNVIEVLMESDKIDVVLELIDYIEDEHAKKMALIYMKMLYNARGERTVISIKNSRKKTINNINNRLYGLKKQ